MKRIIFVTIVCGLTLTMFAQQKKIYEMSNSEIDVMLREQSKEQKTIKEKMNYYSSLFIGMPYNLTCAGDGPYALLETEPMVNFKQTNCMLYCEHVLALSISDSWDNFFNNLQQIRYKDGIIGMRTRNHYTMADWMPENNWLLDDVSGIVGGEFSKQITRTISHKKFFEGKGIDDLRYVLPDREITIDYVAFASMSKVKQNIKDGDIAAILFAKLDNIFSAHMIMMIINDDKLIVRESSNSKMTTFDTPFDEWLKKYEKSEKYMGISLMRVKDELNVPGKIILPWEIAGMK